MICISDKKNCCGCVACAQKCPKNCISMAEDKEGFLYPSVNEDICIDCGICETVCPILNRCENPGEPDAYAAYAKDNVLREKVLPELFFLCVQRRF